MGPKQTQPLDVYKKIFRHFRELHQNSIRDLRLNSKYTFDI